MSQLSHELLRRVINAIQWLNEGKEEELEAFSLYCAANRDEYFGFFQEALECGVTNHAKKIATHDLVKLFLGVQCLCAKVVILCIKSIQKGEVSGRTALVCMSDVRNSLMKSAHLRADGIDIYFKTLSEIAAIVLEPFKGDLEANDISNAAQCLELIPHIVDALAVTRRESKRTMSKLDITIMDEVFGLQWNRRSLLSLANLTLDLLPRLKQRHFVEFKRKMCSAISRNREAVHAEDVPAFVKMCISILELSRDPEWVHIVRIAYKLSASGHGASLATTELLLEPIFARAPGACELIVSVLEDSAAAWDSEENCLIGANQIDSEDAFEYFATGINPRSSNSNGLESCSSHALLSIPAICSEDLGLLLLISRCVDGEKRATGVLGLPPLLASFASNSEAEVMMRHHKSIWIGRAICMLTLRVTLNSNFYLYGVDTAVSKPVSDNASRNSLRSVIQLTQDSGIICSSDFSNKAAGTIKVIEEIKNTSESFLQCVSATVRTSLCGSSRAYTGSLHEMSSTIASSSSSSSSGHRNYSWLSPARAIECVDCILALSFSLEQIVTECIDSVAHRRRPSIVQVNIDIDDVGGASNPTMDVEQAREHRQETPTRDSLENPTSAAAASFDFSSVDLLVEMIASVFECVPQCRSSLLSVLLQSVLYAADLEARVQSSSSSLSTFRLRREGIETKVAAMAGDARYEFVRSGRSILITMLTAIASRFPQSVQQHESTLLSFVPAVFEARPDDTEDICASFVPVLHCSDALFNATISMTRKGISHTIIDRKLSTIRILCFALPALTSAQQVDAARLLCHAFSLSVICRRALYSALLKALQTSYGGSSCIIEKASTNAVPSPTCLISPDALELMKEQVDLNLSFFFVEAELEKCSRIIEDGDNFDFGQRNRRKRRAPFNFVPSSFFQDKIHGGKGSDKFFDDDLYQLVLLGWVIEFHIDAYSAINGLKFSAQLLLAEEEGCDDVESIDPPSIMCAYLRSAAAFVFEGLPVHLPSRSQSDNTHSRGCIDSQASVAIYICCCRQIVSALLACLLIGAFYATSADAESLEAAVPVVAGVLDLLLEVASTLGSSQDLDTKAKKQQHSRISDRRKGCSSPEYEEGTGIVAEAASENRKAEACLWANVKAIKGSNLRFEQCILSMMGVSCTDSSSRVEDGTSISAISLARVLQDIVIRFSSSKRISLTAVHKNDISSAIANAQSSSSMIIDEPVVRSPGLPLSVQLGSVGLLGHVAVSVCNGAGYQVQRFHENPGSNQVNACIPVKALRLSPHSLADGDELIDESAALYCSTSCRDLLALLAAVQAAYINVAATGEEDTLMDIFLSQALIRRKEELAKAMEALQGAAAGAKRYLDDAPDEDLPRTRRRRILARSAVYLELSDASDSEDRDNSDEDDWLDMYHSYSHRGAAHVVDLEESSNFPSSASEKMESCPAWAFLLRNLDEELSTRYLRPDFSSVTVAMLTLIHSTSLRGFQKVTWESSRLALFNARCDLLDAITAAVQSTDRLFTGEFLLARRCGVQKSLLFWFSHRLRLGLYFSSELLKSIGEGLTLRAFKAYTNLLKNLGSFCHDALDSAEAQLLPATHTQRTEVSERMKMKFLEWRNRTSDNLQRCLFCLNDPTNGTASLLLRLMFSFSGGAFALLKCESVMNSALQRKALQSCQQQSKDRGNGASPRLDGNHAIEFVHGKIADSVLFDVLCQLEKSMSEILKSAGNAETNEERLKDRSDRAEVICRSLFGLFQTSQREGRHSSMNNIASFGTSESTVSFSTPLQEVSIGVPANDDYGGPPQESINFEVRLLSPKQRNQLIILLSKLVGQCIRECVWMTRAIPTASRNSVSKNIRSQDLGQDENESNRVAAGSDSHEYPPQSMPQRMNHIEEPRLLFPFLVSFLCVVSSDILSSLKSVLSQLVYSPLSPLHFKPEAADGTLSSSEAGAASHGGTRSESSYANSISKRSHELLFKSEELYMKLHRVLAAMDRENLPSLWDVERSDEFGTNGDDESLVTFWRMIYSQIRILVSDFEEPGNILEPDAENNKDANEEDADSLDREFNSGSRLSWRKKRLRSRNRVIDDWLEAEDGDDAYADLEDFVVY